MNRYIHAFICVVIGVIKFIILKIKKRKRICNYWINLVSPGTEITIDRNGRLTIGKLLRMRSGCKIRVRKNAKVSIGDNFSMSNRCMVVAWEEISIGNNVQFGPGVLVYDQDHDYKAVGGMAAEKYKTSPVKIGNNVWIGANSIILRGTEIGDNSVVAAGTIVKGKYNANSLLYQKKEVIEKSII